MRFSLLQKTLLQTLAAILIALPLMLGQAFAQDSAAPADDTATGEATEQPAPPPVDPNDPDYILHLDLSTGGRVSIRLDPTRAPNHVARIQTLVRQGFYDGIIFHRVIDGLMAQTGDPLGTGGGGSDLPDLDAEFNQSPHLRGTVSMARTSEPNSANSQFFIVFYPYYRWDGEYTNFGRVFAGMQYADAINRGEPPSDPTWIIQASLESQQRPLPDFANARRPGASAARPVQDISIDDLNAPLN